MMPMSEASQGDPAEGSHHVSINHAVLPCTVATALCSDSCNQFFLALIVMAK